MLMSSSMTAAGALLADPGRGCRFCGEPPGVCMSLVTPGGRARRATCVARELGLAGAPLPLSPSSRSHTCTSAKQRDAARAHRHTDMSNTHARAANRQSSTTHRRCCAGERHHARLTCRGGAASRCRHCMWAWRTGLAWMLVNVGQRWRVSVHTVHIIAADRGSIAASWCGTVHVHAHRHGASTFTVVASASAFASMPATPAMAMPATTVTVAPTVPTTATATAAVTPTVPTPVAMPAVPAVASVAVLVLAVPPLSLSDRSQRQISFGHERAGVGGVGADGLQRLPFGSLCHSRFECHLELPQLCCQRIRENDEAQPAHDDGGGKHAHTPRRGVAQPWRQRQRRQQ